VRAAAATPPPDIVRPSTTDATPRLLDKAELLRRVPWSFPTIWAWMRAGTFPRSRMFGQKSVWLESEINDFISSLPIAPIKEAGSEEQQARAAHARAAK
jgi:predicted DNA-binding transcriptional regulator AlpA